MKYQNSIAPETVESHLGTLLGREVIVQEAEPRSNFTEPNLVVAEYSKSDGSLVGLCVCDLGFAISAAAALSMFPAAIAEECLESGELNDQLTECLREVFNVCSRLFEDLGRDRVTLDEQRLPPLSLSEPVQAILDCPKGRTDVTVKVDGYMGGTATFLIA